MILVFSILLSLTKEVLAQYCLLVGLTHFAKLAHFERIKPLNMVEIRVKLLIILILCSNVK